MTGLLAVLLGVLLVLLVVIITGCLFFLWHYLRHRDNVQRLALEVGNGQPGDIRIEINDDRELPHSPGSVVRHRPHPQQVEVRYPRPAQSNHLQVAIGETRTTKVTITTSTTVSRSSSPAPLELKENGAVGIFRPQRVVGFQTTGTESPVLSEHLHTFIKFTNGGDQTKLGQELTRALKDYRITSVGQLTKFKNDSKAPKVLQIFAKHVETAELLTHGDSKAGNEFFKKMFDSHGIWRERVLITDFYRIVNRLNEKCRDRGYKNLQDLELSGNVYIGWNHDAFKKDGTGGKKLVYVAPSIEYYYANYRGKRQFTCEKICHFRYDSLMKVREKLVARKVISDSEYQLQ